MTIQILNTEAVVGKVWAVKTYSFENVFTVQIPQRTTDGSEKIPSSPEEDLLSSARLCRLVGAKGAHARFSVQQNSSSECHRVLQGGCKHKNKAFVANLYNFQEHLLFIMFFLWGERPLYWITIFNRSGNIYPPILYSFVTHWRPKVAILRFTAELAFIKNNRTRVK